MNANALVEPNLLPIREVFRRAGVLVAELNEDGRCQFASEPLERRLGLPSGGALGRSLGDLFDLDPERVGDLVAQARRGEEAVALARGMRLAVVADGARLWVVCQDEATGDESAHRREAVLANIPDPVWLTDHHSRLLAMNDALCAFLGHPRQELIGKTVADLYPPEIAGPILADDRQVLTRNERLRIEEAVPDASGDVRWLETIKSPHRDAEGRVIGIAGIARDFTERKLLQEALALKLRQLENLDLLSNTFAKAQDVEELIEQTMTKVLHTFDCDRAWLLYPAHPDTDSWRIVYEATTPEYPGALAMGIEFPMDATIAGLLREALATTEPLTYGVHRPHPWAGSASFDIASQLSIALRPRLGQPWLLGLHQCSYARDWTPDEMRLFRVISSRLTDVLTNLLTTHDLRRAGQALKESEANFRAIAENAHLGILIAMSGGTHVYANRDACTLTGYSREELARRTLRDVLVASGPGTCETTLLRKGGVAIPVEVTRATTVWLGQTADLALFRDIGERRRLEQERTQLLESERRARAEAEKANRAKDDFLGMISHELRTPLTAILAWAQLLQMGRLDEARAQQAIETIERAARAQRQLVNDLLDVTRIVAGRFALDLRPVDAAEIVKAAVDSIRPFAEGRRVELAVDAGPAAVRSDPTRLQQVVWNLLSNAVKFSREGGRVRIAASTGEGGWWRLTVKDDGAGIPAHLLERIFDPFVQADSSTTRAQGGVGLGLAIVRAIVDLHKGRVWAESPGPGRGAAFTVQLPAAPLSLLAEADPSSHLPSGPSSPCPLDGVRILLVEDEADTRDVLAMLLRINGAEVIAAASAAEARAVLGSQSVDVLVSDIAMPGEDGYRLVSSIRAAEGKGGRRTPAIALTAYASGEDSRLATAAGFDRHLAKPVDSGALVDAILALL